MSSSISQKLMLLPQLSRGKLSQRSFEKSVWVEVERRGLGVKGEEGTERKAKGNGRNGTLSRE